MASESDYIEQYLLAHQNAVIGQARLATVAQDLTLTSSQRASALAAYLQATEDVADLESAHFLLMQNFSPPSPPSAAQIAQANTLAVAVGTEIANAQKVSAIIDALTDLVNGWRAL